MQAHAPKHHGGSIEYLERHLLAALVALGILLASVLAAIAIVNANDDNETVAVPDVVVPTTLDRNRFVEHNTELPPYTAPAEQPSITSYSHPGMGEGWVGGAARPAVAPPAREYSLDWARFLEANGVVGALIDPVMPFEHLRFLEENMYLPGYTVERQLTPPMNGEDMLMLEQNLYLPSDGNGFVDVEPQTTGGDRSDLKAYYEAAMGQGWFVNGELVDPVDMTYSRAVGSWINEGSGEGWLANGKPAAATDSVTQPRDTSNRREGAGTVRPATDDRPVERNR